MAGIGFSLQKIVKTDSLVRVIAGYSTAGIISSSPWIISILSILVMGIFLSVSEEYHQAVVKFQLSITYLVSGSLIISGFAQNSFSRYIADQIFLGKGEKVISNLNGMLLLVTAISGSIAGIFVLFFFPEQSIAYRFLFMGGLVTLSNLWVVINLMTGVKDYTKIVGAFVLCYSVIVGLGFFFKTLYLEGFMLAYDIGQALLLFILLSESYKQYPTNLIIDFHFLKKNQMYKIIMLSGTIFNLAIWSDKFIFWYCPQTSYSILGPLRGSLFYDIPIFIAYLTVTPGMGVQLFLVETKFADYYERFHEAIRIGKSLHYIQVLREQMVNHAYNVIYSIIRIQAVTIVLIYEFGESILKFFHISTLYKNLLFIDVIGTSLQVVCLSILNLLFYMDKREDSLFLSLIFLILNISFSLLSVYLGPLYYGFGFTLALMMSCAYGMHLLDKEFTNLEYKLIVLRK